METLWQNYRLVLVALAVLAGALWSGVYVLPETQQAVIIRTGEPVTKHNVFKPGQTFGKTGAGIIWAWPFIETVQRVDKRIIDLDMERQQVLSADQQRLQVDAYARFRIIDPVKMVQTAGTEEQLEIQLQPILTSELRQELGRRTFASLLTAERGDAMTNVRKNLDTQARQYGAQIIDVRIKRADLPDGAPLDAAFKRMETERAREAATTRAGGQRDAQIIRAEAEAEAARIYAEAYGKDPQFYDFYRAMQSYRQTFMTGDGQSTFILSPDNEYLRQFRGQR